MLIAPATADAGDVVLDSTGWTSQYLEAGTNGVTAAGFYCPGVTTPITITDAEVTLVVRGGKVVAP